MNKKIGVLCFFSILLIMVLNVKSFATTKIDNNIFSIEFPTGFSKEDVYKDSFVMCESYTGIIDGITCVADILVENRDNRNCYSKEYLEVAKSSLIASDIKNIYTSELVELGGIKGIRIIYECYNTYYCDYTLNSDKYVYFISFSSLPQKNLVESDVAKAYFNSFIAKDKYSSNTDNKTIVIKGGGFSDVLETDWFANAVEYVLTNNIIKGYNENTFAPNDNLTRGMLATILYRMEGEPAISGKPKFPDVQDSKQFYYKAVKWATDKGVVAGYNTGKFGPNDNITREQLAVILNRYAKYKGKNVSATNDLKKFSDVSKISDYAVSSMKWAVGAGVITGNDNGTLNPKGNATRAEVAAMMEKYCKKVGR